MEEYSISLGTAETIQKRNRGSSREISMAQSVVLPSLSRINGNANPIGIGERRSSSYSETFVTSPV
jgi:hypothetical protein